MHINSNSLCVPLRDRAEINKDCWEPKAQKAEQPCKIPFNPGLPKRQNRFGASIYVQDYSQNFNIILNVLDRVECFLLRFLEID
jgi:hypothetical protein